MVCSNHLQDRDRGQGAVGDCLPGLEAAAGENTIRLGQTERRQLKIIPKQVGFWRDLHSERGGDRLDALLTHLVEQAFCRDAIVIHQGRPQAHRPMIDLTQRRRAGGNIPDQAGGAEPA